VIIRLLYETGMRIGEALGLRYEDMVTGNNEVHIVPRTDNINLVRAKSGENAQCQQRTYAMVPAYLIEEYPEILIVILFLCD